MAWLIPRVLNAKSLVWLISRVFGRWTVHSRACHNLSASVETGQCYAVACKKRSQENNYAHPNKTMNILVLLLSCQYIILNSLHLPILALFLAQNDLTVPKSYCTLIEDKVELNQSSDSVEVSFTVACAKQCFTKHTDTIYKEMSPV